MMVCAAQPPDDDRWRRERERVRKWRAARSATGRDIGRLPPVQDPERKRRCADSLQDFALDYFPHTFTKPFSRDHLKVIAIMQNAVLSGGLFALAMPRGSGKTSLSEVAALWAVLYGHHRYVVIVGATASGARKLLDTIKIELRTNDRLAADFPEVCYPIRCLEGITNRSAGQRFAGKPTYIRWTADRVVLPTIPGSQASGAILDAAGITSENIRGKKVTTPTGEVLRPSLVIVDDPQTDKSARNPASCEKRESIISGAVLGMAGPGKKIAAVMPCTVIVEDDLADRMLNRDTHPEWNGIRTKTLYSFPTNTKRWDEYAEISAENLRQGRGPQQRNAFYTQHQVEMDAGADVAWPERFRDDELSAIQSAMNRFLRDRAAFMAEDQNEPLRSRASNEIKILSAAEIAEKLNRVPRGQVPLDCSVVEAFIDVQQDVLFWMIAAFSQEFDGGIVDYGTWPDQGRPYFTLSDLRVTIADALPQITSLEGRIYEALDRCTDQIVAREFRRQDGTVLRITREIIDANWMTRVVKKFCRQSKHAALLLPSHGRGIGAKNKPISQYQSKPGEKRGDEWLIGKAAEDRAVRHVIFDTNYWKARVHARLATAKGERGSLTLCGDDPTEHRMLCDHLVSEKPQRVEAQGRTVDEFVLPPHRPDNHWLDGLVGCAVGASIDGCELKHPGAAPPPVKKPRTRNRVSYHPF